MALPEIKDMKLREMRTELEGYGISTRSFLEKREFLDALKKARDEGMTPINGRSNDNPQAQQEKSANGYYQGSAGYAQSAKYSTESSNGQTYKRATRNGASAQQTKTTTTNNSHSNGAEQQQQRNGSTDKTSSSSRKQRLQQELEKAKTMRVGELRQQLKEMGINTKAFFEKSEFVRAYAEAIVDGKGGASGSSQQQQQQQEPFDPEYRDVVLQKFDAEAQKGYLLAGTIIDIDLKQ
ncbi:expressed unknown protein [Seminavis robusta]|uniref:Uncharacterized protein n=1 Tax=Seminavis robusta TaxID=568900 RepID=A0A9N8ESJ8_9STRA|nr:expressed unknown protein [Seminavis robusta]|eukprot:Sro1822_g299820.1 n/a (237) ;mRNA; f:8737-9447